MKITNLYAGAAVIALTAGMAHGAAHGDMAFAKGEGAFSWDSLEEFAANNDFSGETVDITGPWTGNDAERVNSVIA